jgi:cation diffusion facilitator CzcD-associated flavoprotein CzcO
MSENNGKVLIIGGGATGIALGKTFVQRGIDFDIVERENNFAGNWYFGSKASRVYRTTHLISSKTNTQFSDFPMADDYPEYPSYKLFLKYLLSVAEHFGLYKHTLFETSVENLTPDELGWKVSLSNGEERWYPEVVVANGLLRVPHIPSIEGNFSGEIFHSSAYTEPEIFKNKRVLIIGGGNSGCDIAVDSAHYADCTYHSMRRGYHFMPKFIAGMPTQDWLMEIVSQFDSPQEYWLYVKETFKLAGFSGEDYGLLKPDHDIHEAHPIMNSNLLYHLGHGDITSKLDVVEFSDDEVVFTDQSRVKVDMIVLATGFKPDMPFLDTKVINWKKGINQLFLNSLPLTYNNILFAGYFNIPSGFGNLANNCSRFIANYFIGRRKKSHAWRVIDQLKHYHDDIDIGKNQYISTRRHAYELDLWKFIKTVNFLNEKLEASV